MVDLQRTRSVGVDCGNSCSVFDLWRHRFCETGFEIKFFLNKAPNSLIWNLRSYFQPWSYSITIISSLKRSNFYFYSFFVCRIDSVKRLRRQLPFRRSLLQLSHDLWWRRRQKSVQRFIEINFFYVVKLMWFKLNKKLFRHSVFIIF